MFSRLDIGLFRFLGLRSVALRGCQRKADGLIPQAAQPRANLHCASDALKLTTSVNQFAALKCAF